ncbi:MAG: bifunctional ornithine acetyltransferase/N-acetylglutamate synthase [Spirochaetaceae bacterium]
MERYKSREEYEKALELRSKLPKGFKVGVQPLSFFPAERELDNPLSMNLSLILLDKPTESFAGVFTKNRFPGHPITHGRNMLEKKFTQGILINNKISNVRCPDGMASIETILTALGDELNIDKDLFFSSSTGIIGWKLPVLDIINTLDYLNNNLNNSSILPIAKGIMTTDNFPKVRSLDIAGGRIVAIAKGAGMIEPNMATMLVFILTDIKISKETLSDVLKRVMDKTFNRISIDSDQSTSDTGLVFSSNLVEGVTTKQFEESLLNICSDLSQDVVRNGEGTAHVIQVTVKGVKKQSDGQLIGKAIINAPLLKAAIYGNDPNLGRIIQAIGDVAGNECIDIDPEKLTLKMGGETLYENGTFILSQELELKMSNYLKDRAFNEKAIGYPEHRNNVEIVVDLHNGNDAVTVYGSDLSYEYVRENADYRS